MRSESRHRRCLVTAVGHRRTCWNALRVLPLTAVLFIGATDHMFALPSERPVAMTLRRFELLDQLSGAAESEESNAYLRGVADSLEIANSLLTSRGKERLFCVDRPLDISMLRRILRDRIAFLSNLGQESEAAKNRSGVVVAVLQTLRERFPCR